MFCFLAWESIMVRIVAVCWKSSQPFPKSLINCLDQVSLEVAGQQHPLEAVEKLMQHTEEGDLFGQSLAHPSAEELAKLMAARRQWGGKQLNRSANRLTDCYTQVHCLNCSLSVCRWVNLLSLSLSLLFLLFLFSSILLSIALNSFITARRPSIRLMCFMCFPFFTRLSSIGFAVI